MDWMELSLPIIKNIALALVILIIGLFVIKLLTSIIKRKLEKSALDPSLKPFFVSIINATLKILLAIAIIKTLGVETTSFVAVIAASGFAIGLAFQGSLANFAGGVLLLTIRPFNVGDYIEGGGYAGTVRAIQILYTELITADNKVVFIPNGSLSNAGIVNYSTNEQRRVDFTFKISGDLAVNDVILKLSQIAEQHPSVLSNPEPFVRLSSHQDATTEYTMQVWVQSEDYWDVYYDILEAEKKLF